MHEARMSQPRQKCPLTCGFGAEVGWIRTDDLPITSRMLGMDIKQMIKAHPTKIG
jgi:hypothetical protein